MNILPLRLCGHGLLVLALAALAACRASAPAAPTAGSPAMPAPEAAAFSAQAYLIDPAASRLTIHVFRGGRAARLGHNHVLSAPRLQGRVELPGDRAADARFALQLRFDELQIDAPALRAATGGAFAGERSVADIDGTRRNLLKSVEAERFPELQVVSRHIAGDWPVFVAETAITLHGVTRVEHVRLHAEREAGRLRVRGGFAVRQSDYGIAPLSIAAGLLTVQDAVAVDFDLVAVAPLR